MNIDEFRTELRDKLFMAMSAGYDYGVGSASQKILEQLEETLMEQAVDLIAVSERNAVHWFTECCIAQKALADHA